MKGSTFDELGTALTEWLAQVRKETTSVLKSSDRQIFAKFLPPNITALIQPMDQGVIATMKRTYQTKLLMTKIEEGYDLKEFWKHYTILDSIYNIASAWDSVNPSILIKSWRKLIPNVEANNDLTPLSCEENEDVDTPMATLADTVKTVPGGENVDAENINEWLECDVNEPGFECLTDDEIVKKARGQTENEGERSEGEEEPTVQMQKTHKAADC
ncbi:Jerky-like protein, partial [Stegodyphus mimosarum]